MNEHHIGLGPDHTARILDFLGYGSLSAPVWFVGIEEGLGSMSSQDTISNLKARGTFERTMDLVEAHKLLKEKAQFIDIERRPPSTQVWQFMAKIMRAYNGNEDWRDLASAKQYIRFQLGRRGGETFLTELSPIPSSKASDKQWMLQFRKSDPGLDDKLAQRTKDLKAVLAEHRPSLVICYGRKFEDAFGKLLGIRWQPVSNQISVSPDMRCLLVPFFGNGQMSHTVIEDLLASKLLGKRPPLP